MMTDESKFSKGTRCERISNMTIAKLRAMAVRGNIRQIFVSSQTVN